MIKFFLEFAPVIAFFVGYYVANVYTATIYTLITTVICSAISYLVHKKIHASTLISLVLVIITASFTLISGDTRFIKVKPTILYTIFAACLYISNLKNRPLSQFLMQDTGLKLPHFAWIQLNYRLSFFFLSLAALNEIIWRNCSEPTWVKFKVFGSTPLIFIFLVLQIPYITKHVIKQTD